MRARAVIASVLLVLAGACAPTPDNGKAPGTSSAASAVAYRVPIDSAPVLGDARAPVTLVAFSDYECPFCGRADAMVVQLRKAYGPKIRFVMRQSPLGIHPHARAAAIAALAAHEQGRFWPMHERLFASARSLDEESLVRLAGEAGLDVPRWQAARRGAAAALAADEALAAKLGVQGTPTFFVNGHRINGAQPIDTFRQAIDEELAHAESLTARGVRSEDVYAALMKDAVENGPPPQAKAAPAPGTAPAPAATGKPGCDEPGGDCGCKGGEEDDADPRVEEVSIGASPVLGPAQAPVTIVAFTDFECPFCKRAEATLRAVADQYGTRVRFVFKNQPLPMHPSARPAARAALAAGEQGKFWEYHDLLFAHQDALDQASLDRYAKDVGLDLDRFHKAMSDPRTEAAIDTDVAEAARLGVTGTPTFFVNGRRVIGAQPLPKFQSRVELGLTDERH